MTYGWAIGSARCDRALCCRTRCWGTAGWFLRRLCSRKKCWVCCGLGVQRGGKGMNIQCTLCQQHNESHSHIDIPLALGIRSALVLDLQLELAAA
jgi:hypothetical protein